MAWHYHLNGENHGPVDSSELRDLNAREVISLDTPVWTEGMETWAPYGTSSAFVPVGNHIQTPAVTTQSCAQCSQRFPETEMLKYEEDWVCAECKPLFFQRLREGVRPAGNLVFASVPERFVAILVDLVAMGLIAFVVMVPYLMTATIRDSEKPNEVPTWVVTIAIVSTLCIYLVPFIYEIGFIGKYGTTLGKRLMNLKVVRPDGKPVSYLQSAGRSLGKIPSWMLLYVGFLMPFWDSERRALHDHMAGTRVVKRSSLEAGKHSNAEHHPTKEI